MMLRPSFPSRCCRLAVIFCTLTAPYLVLRAALPAQATCSDIVALPDRQDFPALVPGDRGADVRQLQALLTLMGDYRGAINGIFGDDLTNAVKGFQARAGLPSTGQVTSVTWVKLLPRQGADETCREAP